jgi:hypothetical protein
MRTKTCWAVACASVVTVASMNAMAADPAPGSSASGETPPATATTNAPAAAPSDSKMRIGLNVVPMPFLGKLSASVAGISASTDAAFAFGVMPVFDYALNSTFFVGLGPMYTFNVKGKDSMGDAAKEIDIMLRVGGGAPVAEKIQVYGYLSPGYSIVSVPQGDSPKGFVVGAHAGGMMDITPSAFVNAELGYQMGFQSVSGADFKTSFFQIGLGAGMHI